MRNHMFNSLKEDFLFNIDSDILVEPDTLTKLVEADKDMVSAWIYNGYEFSDIKSQYKYWDFTNLCMQRKIVIGDMERIGHVNLKKIDIRRNLRTGVTLLPVDLGGAVCLYRKNLVEDKKVRFFDHIDGEDTPYCILAKDHGYEIFGELTCYCQHIMNSKWLEKYKKNEKIN